MRRNKNNTKFVTISGVTPKPDWNHKPESNGCGSLGIEVSKFYKKKKKKKKIAL